MKAEQIAELIADAPINSMLLCSSINLERAHTTCVRNNRTDMRVTSLGQWFHYMQKVGVARRPVVIDPSCKLTLDQLRVVQEHNRRFI